MDDNHRRRRRNSLRLEGYDYSQPGKYFVTIVTQSREQLFGELIDGEMQLNQFGSIVSETWKWLSEQYPYVEVDKFIVMPDHSHAIVTINDNSGRGGSRPTPPSPERRQKSLGLLIGSFKTLSAKRINILRGTQGTPVWQRGYYDHIIRSQEDLESTWTYIGLNPSLYKDD